ncbi:MAG: hypothetical protein J5599_09590 [Spirochaetales bacterium]|nr:hypothetical protein [Spirochaetales bacterium]
MKKRSLFALCIIAIASVALLASCFMQDPIADNKAIGKWEAKNNEGDTVILDVKSDQTFTMTEQQTGGTFILDGTWTASSVSQGTMTITLVKTTFDFTAYDTELTLYKSGEEPFTLKRVAQ